MTVASAAVNNTNKKETFKNCAPYTDYITEINNTQVDDAQKIDAVMLMYNLIEYSYAYQKTPRSLCQYYTDEPALNASPEIINFPANNNNNSSFKFKEQITGQTANSGTKAVEIMTLVKYLSNFWRALEMPLINCEINLHFKW